MADELPTRPLEDSEVIQDTIAYVDRTAAVTLDVAATALGEETERAIAAEAVIAGKVVQEATRATAAEADLRGALTSEVTRAKASELVITEKLVEVDTNNNSITCDTIDDLKNLSPLRYKTVILADPSLPGIYSWRPGDASHIVNDRTQIASNVVPATEGAWFIVDDTVGKPIAATVAATAAINWSSMPSLARKLEWAAYRGTGPNPVEIVWFVCGSSNARGAGVGGEGGGYSPGEVLMRQAQRNLDPYNTCTWRLVYGGANGTAYGGFYQRDFLNPADPDDLRSIYQKMVDAKPDVTVVCYGTNDGAMESYTSGQTRDAVGNAVLDINRRCKEIDSDVIHMTVVDPHVGKKSTPNAGGFSGNMINQSVPSGYPFRSFSCGITPFNILQFTIDATTKRLIATASGIFNSTRDGYGFGLEVGKVIELGDEYLGGTILNAGRYYITAKDPDGDWLELGRGAFFNEFGMMVDDGPSFLIDETANMSIRRIAIDPETEQLPRLSKSVVDVDVLGDGNTVKALQTYLDINSDIRRYAAMSSCPCVVLDCAAGALTARRNYENPDDRWYTQFEVVHWNTQFVHDVMEPMASAMFASLGPVQRAVSNKGLPNYYNSLVLRPDAAEALAIGNFDYYGVREPLDLQIGGPRNRGVIRNSDGKPLLEFKGGRIVERRYTTEDTYNEKHGFWETRFNINVAQPMVWTPPAPNGILKGTVLVAQNAVSDTLYQIYALLIKGVWTITSTKLVSAGKYPGTESGTFSGVNGNFVITPIADTTTVVPDLIFTSTEQSFTVAKPGA